MKAAAVISKDEFHTASQQVTRLREVTRIEAVVRLPGEPETTCIAGIRADDGKYVALHAPYISFGECLQMNDDADTNEHVRYDRIQIQNAMGASSHGMKPSRGDRNRAEIQKVIKRELEKSPILGKARKTVVIKEYAPERGDIHLSISVPMGSGLSTNHEFGIHGDFALWIRKEPGEVNPTIVVDDRTGCVSQIKRICHNNDPKFRFG